MPLCMFEFFKTKSENPATVARKLETRKQDLRDRITEIKAHIQSGNGTPLDGPLLTRLELEQSELE